jgi:hypothetical protein
MMKTMIKSIALAAVAVLIYFADTSPQAPGLATGLQWVSDAHAVAGGRRRSRRRGVAIGASAGAAAASSASASEQQTESTQQPAAAPPPVYGSLPLGTVVTVLPAGCEPVTSGNVSYQHCGENYFRSAFQGNSLVYVTTTPGEN